MPNPRCLPALAGPRIALPCDVPWDAMQGDERVRACGQCKKLVYNLSALTTREAMEQLRREPAACIRYYQRPDGTVLTSDCPVGVRKRRKRRIIAAAAAATGLVSVAVFSAGGVFSPVPVAVFTIDQMAQARRATGQIRMEGTLVHGSIASIPGGVRFELRSRQATIAVRHRREVLPDNFRDLPAIDLSVMVEGVLRKDGTFDSFELLAKAPSGVPFDRMGIDGHAAPL